MKRTRCGDTNPDRARGAPPIPTTVGTERAPIELAEQLDHVVLFSGDLHAGAMDNGTNSGVVEMVSPSANFSPQSPERCLSADVIGIWSHGTYANLSPPRVCNGYGVAYITPMQMILQVKDEMGVIKLQQTVPVQ